MRADACADALLTFATPPDFCEAFGADVLDYYGNAMAFVRDLDIAPGANVLYSGHSLGALLATLVAATVTRDEGLTPPALVFSAPGFDAIASAKGASATLLDPTAVLVVADTNDPVYREALGNLTGATACAYDTGVDADCDRCFESRPDANRPDCQSCFLHHHVYGHYLGLLSSSARPRCAPAAAEAGLPPDTSAGRSSCDRSRGPALERRPRAAR